jgi:SAM-dependent methyltransferase
LSETIAYYERNAEKFFNETVQVDMSALYEPFMALLPPNGTILDAGCGSGRDSLHFKRHGFQVEAFDASIEMCRLASRAIGQTVQLKTFGEIDWISEFDAIWACASLLHVGRDSIDAVMEKLCRALKPDGVMFASFKLRDEEWEQDGRRFNGYSENSFRHLLLRHSGLVPISIWSSSDARPARSDEKWLNALLRKTAASDILP